MNLLLGIILKCGLNYYLTAIPGIEIRGAAVATVGAFGLAFILNYIILTNLLKYKVEFWKMLIKPIIAVAIMALVVPKSYLFLAPYSLNLGILVTVLVGMVAYFVTLFILGAIKKEDIVAVPKIGSRLAVVLQKFKLLR
ncbi:polysaccharide biosynthesis C-terminal domain-containing protein [Bacillota bacterium LX-D]|nr:polysaccharide biosynthesis C-terminal domain-containing protein [Bacillota bacterium LX-D]